MIIYSEFLIFQVDKFGEGYCCMVQQFVFMVRPLKE